MLVLTCQLGRADFTFTGGTGGDIPVGNWVGMTSVGHVSGSSPDPVTGMSLNLNISGGFNGDLYAYLVAPDQTTTASLLGTVGGNFTQVGSGYDITLASGHQNINSATQHGGALVTGTYSPVVDLMTTFGSYINTHGGPGGDWRLFVANQSVGGGQSTLGTWSLNFTTTAVPEPEQVVAISLLGLIGLMVGSYRNWGRALGLKKFDPRA